MHLRSVVLLVLLTASAGCSKDNAVDAGTRVAVGIGEQCSRNDDCGVSAVCVLGYCRRGCTTDSQCPLGALCIGETPPYGCQLPADAVCNDTDKKCVPPLTCGLDKTCRMPCESSKDCPRNEHECHAGVCVGDGEKGEAAIAYRSCTDGAMQCANEDCFSGACELQTCNTVKPGWATLSQCAGESSLCGAGKCEPNVGELVAVKSPLGGTYGIDATEVTRAQYAIFVAAKNGDMSGQLPECDWNTTYEPEKDWPPADRAHHPINRLDWCDAYAYCKWAGKRLCGRIEGGPNGVGESASAKSSQWYNVCSSGGQNDYPYGKDYVGTTCNVGDRGEGQTLPVTAASSCVSTVEGYEGVYDLSGNAPEWEDSCDATTGPNDECRMRGGGYTDVIIHVGCSYAHPARRNWAWPGIRCCSDVSCNGTLCDQPPPDSCVDSTHFASYGPLGMCIQGQCQYTPSIVECKYGCVAGGCDAGPCTGVTCDSPPAGVCADGSTLTVHDVPGTCSDGVCSYASHPKDCQIPPANECADATTLTVYQPGLCKAGACVNEGKPHPCPYGCAAGACQCGGKSCNLLEECFNDLFCVANRIPVNADSVSYHIDATETTRAHYMAWLGTNPSTALQDPMCVWNTDFSPSHTGTSLCDGSPWPPASGDNHPMACVDWCDAAAYCKGVGKRLCGRIGGGSNLPSNVNNRLTSQWYLACAPSDYWTYPYGSDYQAEICNGEGMLVGKSMQVGACKYCTTGMGGATDFIFDMSGNVREWEDTCDSGTSVCHARGGSYLDAELSLRCVTDEPAVSIHDSTAAIGFRCCSDP